MAVAAVEATALETCGWSRDVLSSEDGRRRPRLPPASCPRHDTVHTARDARLETYGEKMADAMTMQDVAEQVRIALDARTIFENSHTDVLKRKVEPTLYEIQKECVNLGGDAAAKGCEITFTQMPLVRRNSGERGPTFEHPPSVRFFRPVGEFVIRATAARAGISKQTVLGNWSLDEVTSDLVEHVVSEWVSGTIAEQFAKVRHDG